jgi:plasmid stabilization system protein ParE
MAGDYTVEMKPLATKDLDGILRYLMNEYSKETATNTYFAIMDKVDGLSKMPHANPVYINHSDKLIAVIRWVIAKKVYKVYYSINENKQHVVVARIKHVKSSDHTVLNALEEE